LDPQEQEGSELPDRALTAEQAQTMLRITKAVEVVVQTLSGLMERTQPEKQMGVLEESFLLMVKDMLVVAAAALVMTIMEILETEALAAEAVEQPILLEP
jgi:hypothetical protein